MGTDDPSQTASGQSWTDSTRGLHRLQVGHETGSGCQPLGLGLSINRGGTTERVLDDPHSSLEKIRCSIAHVVQDPVDGPLRTLV